MAPRGSLTSSEVQQASVPDRSEHPSNADFTVTPQAMQNPLPAHNTPVGPSSTQNRGHPSWADSTSFRAEDLYQQMQAQGHLRHSSMSSQQSPLTPSVGMLEADALHGSGQAAPRSPEVQRQQQLSASGRAGPRQQMMEVTNTPQGHAHGLTSDARVGHDGSISMTHPDQGEVSPRTAHFPASPAHPMHEIPRSAGPVMGPSSASQRQQMQFHHRHSSLGQVGALAQKHSPYASLRMGTASPLGEGAQAPNERSTFVPGKMARTGTTPNMASMAILGNNGGGFVRSLSGQHMGGIIRPSSPPSAGSSSWVSPGYGATVSAGFSPMTPSSGGEFRFVSAPSMDSRDTSMDSLSNSLHSTSASRASSTSEDFFGADGRNHRQKRKTKLHNLDRKRICEYFLAHPKSKQDDLANVFGIERSTVSKVLKDKERWLSIDLESADSQIVKHRTARFPEIEKSLETWAHQTLAAGETLSDSMIKAKALEIAKSLGGGADKFKASGGWVDKFRERAGLRKRNPSNDDGTSSEQVSPHNSASAAFASIPSGAHPASMSATTSDGMPGGAHPSVLETPEHRGRQPTGYAAGTAPNTPLSRNPPLQPATAPVLRAVSDGRAEMGFSPTASEALLENGALGVRTTPTSTQKRHYDSMAASHNSASQRSVNEHGQLEYVPAATEGRSHEYSSESSKRRRGADVDSSASLASDPSVQAEGQQQPLPAERNPLSPIESAQMAQEQQQRSRMESAPGTGGRGAAHVGLGSPFNDTTRQQQSSRHRAVASMHDEEFQRASDWSYHSGSGRRPPLHVGDVSHGQREAYSEPMKYVVLPDGTQMPFHPPMVPGAVSASHQPRVFAAGNGPTHGRGDRQASPLRPLRLADLGRSNTSPSHLSNDGERTTERSAKGDADENQRGPAAHGATRESQDEASKVDRDRSGPNGNAHISTAMQYPQNGGKHLGSPEQQHAYYSQAQGRQQSRQGFREKQRHTPTRQLGSPHLGKERMPRSIEGSPRHMGHPLRPAHGSTKEHTAFSRPSSAHMITHGGLSTPPEYAHLGPDHPYRQHQSHYQLYHEPGIPHRSHTSQGMDNGSRVPAKGDIRRRGSSASRGSSVEGRSTGTGNPPGSRDASTTHDPPISLDQARQSLDVVLQFLNESEADIIPRSHFLTLGSLHGSLAAAAARARGSESRDL